MTGGEQLAYAGLWLLFGFLHSVLASDRAKQALAFLGRGYRLAYNGFAVLHAGATVWIGERIFGADAVTVVPEAARWAGYALMAVGLIVLALAMRLYDGGRFLGLTQVRRPDAAEDEPLRVSGLHRYVRHPLYSGAILLLWGRVGTEAELATAVWATAYFIIGAWFEERRLIVRYGNAYRRYRAAVPGFVPWKGRVRAD